MKSKKYPYRNDEPYTQTSLLEKRFGKIVAYCNYCARVSEFKNGKCVVCLRGPKDRRSLY